MPFDLQTLGIAVGIVVGLLTILATVSGWFAKAWAWTYSLFQTKAPVGVIDVPSKTMVLTLFHARMPSGGTWVRWEASL